MRALTREQKELLNQWAEENNEEITLHFSVEHDLPYDLWMELQELNDNELLHQLVEAYVSDLAAGRI